MKLLLRLSLTLLSVVLLVMAGYFSLPFLLVSIAHYQLEQQGFSNIDIELGDLNLQSANVVRMQMSRDDMQFDVKELRAGYHVQELFSGTINSIYIEQLTVKMLPNEAQGSSLPDPVVLSGLLALISDQAIPVASLNIENFSLYRNDGSQPLTAKGEIHQQGQGIVGEITVVDKDKENYVLNLEVMPKTGIGLELRSQHTDFDLPLAIKINNFDGKTGVNGNIELDLSQLASIFRVKEKLSGKLEADITYFTSPDIQNLRFNIKAGVKDLVYAGAQIDKVSASLNGTVNYHESGFHLMFQESSQVMVQDLKQGSNTLEKMLIRLPRSLDIVDGDVQISGELGANIILNELQVEDVHMPRAELTQITISSFTSNLKTERCQFKMQLTTSLVEMADVRFEPAPIWLTGTCPESLQEQWFIRANLDNISYEDTSFKQQLHDCHLQLGNSEHGKLFDDNPVELGGELSCLFSEISGPLRADFRFNPVTGFGSADYSVADINPSVESPLIASVLKDWQQPFDIVSGTLKLQGQYRWWKNTNGLSREKLIANLNMQDAGGHYAGILFSNLNYHDTIELLPRLNSLESSRISLAHIDIGIPVSQAVANIRFKATGTQLPLLTVNDLELSLLDGKVKASELKFDLNAKKQNLQLLVEDLDLAQIVKLQQVDGLSVSGRLDGVLPVAITSKGLKIEQGLIFAQQKGGHIQYQPTGDTAHIKESALGSELVFNVLEDMNYDSLIVDVNYAEDGELGMQLAIKGKSPKVDAERPIHFNLNLQQNVLQLLRALRYTEGINDEIDKNVQKYFQGQ